MTLSGPAMPPFTLSAASSSTSVAAGSSATYQLSIAAASGFPLATSVGFSCSGLPAESTCAFSPATVAAGATAQTVTLTISTTASTHAFLVTDGSVRFGLIPLGLVLLFPRRRERRFSRLLALAFLVVGLPGCAGGGGNSSTNNSPGTPPGTYSVVVAAAQPNIFTATQTINPDCPVAVRRAQSGGFSFRGQRQFSKAAT